MQVAEPLDYLSVGTDSFGAAVGTDGQSNRDLWAAVLLQAILDYRHCSRPLEVSINRISYGTQRNDITLQANKRNAALWFSERERRGVQPEVGSFLWVCDVLGLDADVVRAKVKANISKKGK
jgi:hypothetical protein